MLNEHSVRQRIRQALEEDIRDGDVTTLAIIPAGQQSTALIKAKSDGVLCGTQVADWVLQECGSETGFTWNFKEGDRLVTGQIAGTYKGPTRVLLMAERTLLNFIQRMSGIATQTRRFTDLVSHTSCKILDTRKTVPGLRDLDKYSVKTGGGTNHRIGLYDMVLIKDNHIAAAGSVTEAIKRVHAWQKQTGRFPDIEVEVKNRRELAEVLALGGVQRILLDNMTLAQLAECVKETAGRIPLEASGNVNLETVAGIAGTGVDFVSVGSLTHSVTAMDLSLLID
ncbi:MAG: carboxylating nicotinate-nucleotide diphosphorylase [Bacteroidetes bacterium]|nr:carboxylating nicotinate-nucleotide diphosphorylase [Bacteroidota bacterium]